MTNFSKSKTPITGKAWIEKPEKDRINSIFRELQKNARSKSMGAY